MAKKKATTAKKEPAEKLPAKGSEQVVLIKNYQHTVPNSPYVSPDTITWIKMGKMLTNAFQREDGIHAVIEIIGQLTPEEKDNYYSQSRFRDEHMTDAEQFVSGGAPWLGSVFTCTFSSYYNAWTADWPASKKTAIYSGWIQPRTGGL